MATSKGSSPSASTAQVTTSRGSYTPGQLDWAGSGSGTSSAPVNALMASRAPAMASNAISGGNGGGGGNALNPVAASTQAQTSKGKFSEVGNFVAHGAKNVNAALPDILGKAAAATGMTVEAFSGYRPGDPRFHGKGMATDVSIFDENGKKISNYQDPTTFGKYQQFAHAAREIQQRDYPNLDNSFRWGGYFSGGAGKYGAMDLMHFDLGGDKIGMGGGSWEKGLNNQQAKTWGLKPGFNFDNSSDASTALAFNDTKKQKPASDAIDSIMTGTPKSPMGGMNTSYVPPPGSTDQPRFAPLPGAAVDDFAPPVPMARPDPGQPPQNGSDYQQMSDANKNVAQSWGLDDGNPAPSTQIDKQGGGQNNPVPDQSTPDQPSDPHSAIKSAWGLDDADPSTDAAPASGLAKDDKTKPEASSVAPVSVNDAGRAFATGVPIIGGALNAADAAVNATLAPVLNPIFDKKDQLQGDTWSERYANSKAQQDAMDNKFHQDHPYVDAGLNIAGGVMATAPIMLAAPGAFGMNPGAASGIRNVITGAGSNALMGAADSAVRSGGDLTETRNGALIGGVLGGAAPFAGKVIGAGANKLMRVASNMTAKGSAANALKSSLENSGATVEGIGQEMAANPRLRPMDVNDALQLKGQRLVASGENPAARQTLVNSASALKSSAADTVNSIFDNIAGPVPDVPSYIANLKDTAKANGTKNFGDALTGAKPVNVQPVLDSIDQMVNPGVNGVVSKTSEIPQGPKELALMRVRSMIANGDEQLTDAQRLHQIQSQIRTEAETLKSSASGQDRIVGNALSDVRQKIVSQIDEAAGGKYRPAQKQYADDMSINEAFNKGLSIASNNSGTSEAAIANRPEYWQNWMKDASEPEVAAAKVGARVAYDQQVNSVRNAALKGETIPEIGFNLDRAKVLFGEDQANQMAKALNEEKKIANTNAKLVAGSKTAETRAEDPSIKVTQVKKGLSLNIPVAGAAGFGVGGIPGAVAGVGLSMANMGRQALLRSRDMARNRLIAEAITGDFSKFSNALTPAMKAGQAGVGFGQNVNRLMSLSAPSTGQQINGINENVPLNVPTTPHEPLRITVRRKKKLIGQ